MLEKTIELIQHFHDGQTDWQGNPYWMHPVAVMARLPARAPEHWKKIALLHDIVEDCRHKFVYEPYKQLRMYGYIDDVVEGVRLLTRTPGMKYLDEIRTIASSGNIGAMHVKLADNCENTDVRRLHNLFDAQLNIFDEQLNIALSMRKRYEKSKTILRDSLSSFGYNVDWSFL